MINDFPDVNLFEKRKADILDVAESLNTISFQVAELLRIKEELEKRLSAMLEHSDDCQKTYTEGKFKITITTGYNYTLDKEEYEVIKERIPVQFDAVRKRIAYDIDKRLLTQARTYADVNTLALIDSIITANPKKLNVKITSGC